MGLLGHFRRGGLARADGPDGLVGDDQVVRDTVARGSDDVERGFHLRLHGRDGVAGLTLFEQLGAIGGAA